MLEYLLFFSPNLIPMHLSLCVFFVLLFPILTMLTFSAQNKVWPFMKSFQLSSEMEAYVAKYQSLWLACMEGPWVQVLELFTATLPAPREKKVITFPVKGRDSYLLFTS